MGIYTRDIWVVTPIDKQPKICDKEITLWRSDMKGMFLILALIVIGIVSYYYMSPGFHHYQEQIDAQAYQRTNLLEGIDTDYVAPRQRK
jgi:hypothetical protein